MDNPTPQPVPQQVPPQVPVTPPKRNWKITFAVAAALLLLSIGVFTIVNNQNKKVKQLISENINPTPTTSQPSPTPDETANWKTYTDNKYAFSIQYPPTWRQTLSTNDYDNSNYHLLFSDPQPFADQIEVRVIDNPNKLNSLEYFKTEAFKNDLPGWNNNLRSTKTVNLPNIDGIRIEGFTGGSGDRGPTAFISKGTIVFEIITQNPSDTGASIFDQMLSTFKFTE